MSETPLSPPPHPSERYVALSLQVGAYGSFAVLLVALVLAALGQSSAFMICAKIGILLLMATPTVRIIAAVFMYAIARDKKMIFVSVGVLLIVLVSSLVGLDLR